MASVADDLTAGVVALLGTLGLAGATVKDRKVGAVTADDAPPLVCVSIADDWEEWETADDAAGRAGHYRLLVAVARKSPLTLGDKATDRAWRQLIRRQLTRAPGLTGVPAVDWVNAAPTPEFDPGLLDAGWNWSVLAFDVKTREPRD